MKKFKMELQESIPCSKGSIEKGSIYKWSEDCQAFVYRDRTGEILSTVNFEAAKAFPKFKLIEI
jgi:hypothetical protein